MLVIRLQRTGRKGYGSFRVIVQDSRKSPMSGKIVEYLGSYNPHTKEVVIDKEKTAKFLQNGANPSPLVVKLLKDQGIKLPKWVAKPLKKKGEIRNPEKRRSTAPEGVAVEKPAEESKEEATETKEEAPAPSEPTEAAEAEPKEEVKEAEPPAAEEPEKTEEKAPETEETKASE